MRFTVNKLIAKAALFMMGVPVIGEMSFYQLIFKIYNHNTMVNITTHG